jgi:hypothetical protein
MRSTTYEIMHKECCVATVSTTGAVTIYEAAFLPYGLSLKPDTDDLDERLNNRANFEHWCASRVLQLDRRYAKEILNSIGASQSATDRDRAQIALSYHCLCLYDVYWVREQGEDVSFAQINLYERSLDSAFVDLSLRGKAMTVQNSHLIAGDLSASGCFPKAWVRTENGFVLYKDGDASAVESELLASQICRCFDCNQVLYEAGEYDGEKVSISKLIASPDVSLVSREAYDVYAANQEIDPQERILKLDARGYYMMNILDYLVGNIDRHWGNWGLLIDNATNRPLRLYDLMDFNQSFKAYDTMEGARCLTMPGKKPMTQQEAATEAVAKIGLNQIAPIPDALFAGREDVREMFRKRYRALEQIDQTRSGDFFCG